MEELSATLLLPTFSPTLVSGGQRRTRAGPEEGKKVDQNLRMTNGPNRQQIQDKPKELVLHRSPARISEV